ncbi:MAG: hypothetical protein ABJG47_17745 [Ekhidna sp.]
MTKLTQEQIDNYHSGRMNESEMADFENLLESDPAMKSESNLQSDIVSGLKEYRKNQLKSRLDAIDVGPTWMEFAQQSVLMKSMGGVIIASIIGTGIYLYGERMEVLSTAELATVEALEVESIEFVWDLGEEEAESNNSLEKPEQITDQASKKIAEAVPQIEEQSDVVNEEVTAIANNDSEKTEVFKPVFEAPDAESVEDDAEFSATDLDKLSESSDNAADEQPIDVQTELSKGNKIRYKYYDGKLFLNGDFDKAPYEILEINSARDRRIYVYHLGSYYKVDIADKLTELPKVTNPDVISELKLLRENK